jgi:hypothetical protein
LAPSARPTSPGNSVFGTAPSNAQLVPSTNAGLVFGSTFGSRNRSARLASQQPLRWDQSCG